MIDKKVFDVARQYVWRGARRSWSEGVHNSRWIIAEEIAEKLGRKPHTVFYQIWKWRRGGRVRLRHADEYACAFGKHLSELYGKEWEQHALKDR